MSGPGMLRTRALILALAIASMPAAAGAGPSRAFTLEAAPCVPWAFCTATARSANGMSGRLRLHGLDRDGSRAELFEADVDYADELTIRYWADDDLAAIVAELETPEGERLEARVEFPYSETKDGSAALLAGLTFPFREMPLGEPPRSADFAGIDPTAAARAASNALFATGRKPAALIIPAAWASLAILLAFRPETGTRSRARATVLVLATLAATAGAAMLAGTEGALFVLDIPDREGPFTAVLERTDKGGFETLRWSAPDGGGTLSFLAIRPSRGAGLDLEALGRYRRLRFARPPLVTLDGDGAYRVTAGGYLAAWGSAMSKYADRIRMAAAVLAPLALIAVLPAGLDRPPDPALAALLPFAWAFLVDAIGAADRSRSWKTLAAAAPFAGYTAFAFSTGAHAPWPALAAAACAAASSRYAAGPGTRARWLGPILFLLLSASQLSAGPWASLAASALAASARLALDARRRRA